MTKFRLYFNSDKETEWLNEMARRGYAMTGFAAGFYSFDACQPGEYVYQIDVAEGMFRVSNDYREFMREVDVEIVCVWGIWVFLRKKVEGAFAGTHAEAFAGTHAEAFAGAHAEAFALYTDVESRIEYYTKIKRAFSVVIVIESICLFMELLVVTIGRRMGALGFSFLIMAILIALMRELMRVNDIIDELKGRIGQAVCNERKAFHGRKAFQRRKRIKPSLFIPAGLLMNALALSIPVWDVGSNGFQYGFLKGFFQGLALIFLIVGLVLNVRQRRG